MTTHAEDYPDQFHDTYSKTTFGFWIFLVSDFVLFGVLFAVYAVLHQKTFGGPGSKELFELPFNLLESFLFLCVSFTSGMFGAYAHRRDKKGTLLWMGITILFILGFLTSQYFEFSKLIQSGNRWSVNAFLSSFFSIVGTHTVHILFGLIWTILGAILVFFRGIDLVALQRITCLKMFWQFLGIVYIFIFTIVYLMGVV